MARTEFVGSSNGGDSLPRATRRTNGGSRPPDLGAIDVRLDEVDSNAAAINETAGSTSNEQRSQPVPEAASQPRELLSESTDLNALMVAILGEDAREDVPPEYVAQSQPLDIPDPVSDAAVPWQTELETLLADERPPEVAVPSGIPTPPIAESAPKWHFSALVHLSAAISRWPMSRVALLTVSALAGMTLGVVAWQSAKSDQALPSMPPPTSATAVEPPSTRATPGVASTIHTTDAAERSRAAGGAGQGRSAGSPRSSTATSSSNARGRNASAAPAEAREAARGPSRAATSPPVRTGPVESAPAQETAMALELPPPGTETGTPPQPAATIPSPANESIAPAAPSSVFPAGSPAGRGTAGGSAAGAAGPTPPAAAPPIVVQRTEPRLLRRAVPEYPNHLRRAKIGGSVTVMMTVDAEGRVVNVRSVSGPSALRPAAEAAAQRWLYAPATVNGTPLESFVNVTFIFDPSDASQTSR